MISIVFQCLLFSTWRRACHRQLSNVDDERAYRSPAGTPATTQAKHDAGSIAARGAMPEDEICAVSNAIVDENHVYKAAGTVPHVGVHDLDVSEMTIISFPAGDPESPFNWAMVRSRTT